MLRNTSTYRAALCAGLILLLCFSLNSAQAQSLLHHYSFDGASLMEASGGYSLTPAGGVSPTADRFEVASNAYAVDGSSFSELASPGLGVAQVTTAFTLAAWVYVFDPSVDQKIFGHFDSFTFSGPLMGINAGSLDGEIVGSAQTRLTMGAIPDSTWIHVAVTWEQNGSFTGYLNGSTVGSVAAMSGTVPAGAGLTLNHIGSAPWDAFYFVLNGSIDDVRMYDYALTDLEVAALACPLSLSTAGTATGITSTGAVLDWTTGGGEVHIVEYGLAGFTPGIGLGTATTTLLPSLSVSGLTADTDYEFYVADSCSLLTSPWAGPFPFSTLAAPCLTPTAVSIDATSTTTADLSWVSANPVYMEWGLAGFALGSGTVETGITSPYALTGLTPGADYDFYLSQLCFFGNSDTVGPFSITTTDSCAITPLALAASGLTNVGATISWTDAGGAISTDLEWGPALFSTGTGTIVTGVSSPYDLMGLSPSASYDVYLRHNCNTLHGPWEGPLNFSTVSVGLEPVFGEYLTLLADLSGRKLLINWEAPFEAAYTLYDEAGREISTGQLASGSGLQSLSVAESGFYLLEIYSMETGERQSKAFVFPK